MQLKYFVFTLHFESLLVCVSKFLWCGSWSHCHVYLIRVVKFAACEGLHALMIGVMQPQLASGSRLVASAYGDVLYRAWKEEGNDQLKLAMEESVQSFIHQAIHAADTRYFRSLRILLGTFHDSKRVKGVDSMLLRVYGPIIWRSLRCANAIVRAQATIIFFDTFPLQNEEAGAAETDALLQKQFDLFGSLLRDTDHRVRAAAASGVPPPDVATRPSVPARQRV